MGKWFWKVPLAWLLRGFIPLGAFLFLRFAQVGRTSFKERGQLI
jgi:hypothetical protein